MCCNRPVSQSWVGNVTGALSLGCPKHFISGQTELQENGWWKLAVDRPPMLEPNQISNARKTGGGRGRGRSTRRGGKRKTANGVSADFGNSLPSPHLFPSALSVSTLSTTFSKLLLLFKVTVTACGIIMCRSKQSQTAMTVTLTLMCRT